MAIWFNKQVAKELGRKKFISTFAKVYPDADLAAEYEKMFPPKKETKDKVPEAPKSKE